MKDKYTLGKLTQLSFKITKKNQGGWLPQANTYTNNGGNVHKTLNVTLSTDLPEGFLALQFLLFWRRLSLKYQGLTDCRLTQSLAKGQTKDDSSIPFPKRSILYVELKTTTDD